MKLLSRRYQVLQDQATCHQPGCSWHFEGDIAEMLAEAHAYMTGHQAWVTVTARLIFSNLRTSASKGGRGNATNYRPSTTSSLG